MLRKQLDAAKGNSAFGQGAAQGGAAGGSGATVATGPGGIYAAPTTGTAPPPPTNLTTAPGANTPTGDPAAPYKNNGQPPPAKPQDFNGSEDAFLQSLMNGANNVDTGYLQQIFGDQAAHNRVNARASMGRAGLGSSGALSAMEGDQGRKDTQAMNVAVQQQRQQGIQNALGGINADATLEGTRANDAILRQILGLGNDPGAGPPTQGPGGVLGTGIGAGTGAQAGGGKGNGSTSDTPIADVVNQFTGPTSSSTLASSAIEGGKAATTSAEQAVGAPPPDAHVVAVDADGTKHYVDSHGKRYVVRVARQQLGQGGGRP